MSLTPTRVAVTVAAIQLVAAAGTSGSPNRRSVTIYNSGPNPIAIGPDNTVTLAGGFLIPSGASLTIDKDPAEAVWALCSVLQVTPADTSILVES